MGFDPVSLGLMVAGTAVSAYGQYQAGRQEQAVAEYNAKVQEREAQAETQKSVAASRLQAEEASRRMSTLRAQFMRPSAEGTPLDIIMEQARQSERENIMVGEPGMTEARRLRSRAKIGRYAGKEAAQAGAIGAGTTLLTGFSEAYQMK